MASTAPPKMPQRINELHRQIMAHPDYNTRVPESARWTFEHACVRGGSWCAADNNKWSREIWKTLYTTNEVFN